MLLNIKCVLIFSTTFVRNISHSEKSSAVYDQKCILIFMKSTRYSCPILMKFEFSRHFFEKYSNIKFHKNPPSRCRIFYADRRMDEQTDKTKIIVAFRNFENAPKKIMRLMKLCKSMTFQA